MYDIITVGSANIDAFVKTKLSKHRKKHQEHFDICEHMGQKLLIEDFSLRTGGSATNTSVAFSRLGLKTGSICVLGSDQSGKTILEELKKEKVSFLGPIKSGDSGFGIVLRGYQDRIILSYKGLNNNLLWSDLHISKLKTKYLYLSTMIGKSLKTIEKLSNYASKNGIKTIFNPSIYLAKQGAPKLKSLLRSTDILVLNKEEASALVSPVSPGSPRTLIKRLSKYTKGIIVITSGFAPALAYHSGVFYEKKFRKVSPLDKTGAGDAFASGFVYGIIKSKGIQKSLDYGHKLALSVMNNLGAKEKLLRKL
jgi:ribokinase